MNKNRKNKILTISRLLNENLKELSNICSEEEMYLDNIPENLLSSERAEDSENAIEIMQECIEKIEEICVSLEEI